ncbi:hypothetical protein P7L87_26540 [Vibrio parahaemolyticus]|nr:hypothetical protein [Vibrio parahaemolyticus]
MRGSQSPVQHCGMKDPLSQGNPEIPSCPGSIAASDMTDLWLRLGADSDPMDRLEQTDVPSRTGLFALWKLNDLPDQSP